MEDGIRRIQLGDKVMLKRDAAGHRVDIYRVVPPAEADPETGRISADSPLGSAILGRAAGETVEFEVAGSSRTILILKIVQDPV